MLFSLIVLPGFVPGIIALRHLVEQNWDLPGVRSVTWAYVVFTVLNVVMCLLASLTVEGVCSMIAILPLALVFVVYYMMDGYTDWVVGLTVDNIGGLPFKKGQAVSYFLGALSDAFFQFF